MMACSLLPEESIIAMDFNSPKEVEKYILERNIPITHWVLYNYCKHLDKIIVVYEKKDDEVVINKFFNIV